jgi:hypothetical protein
MPESAGRMPALPSLKSYGKNLDIRKLEIPKSDTIVVMFGQESPDPVSVLWEEEEKNSE